MQYAYLNNFEPLVIFQQDQASSKKEKTKWSEYEFALNKRQWESYFHHNLPAKYFLIRMKRKSTNSFTNDLNNKFSLVIFQNTNAADIWNRIGPVENRNLEKVFQGGTSHQTCVGGSGSFSRCLISLISMII